MVPVISRLIPMLMLMGSAVWSAETNVTPSRLSVAILSFEDQTGDAQFAHWRFSLPRLLRESLAGVSSLRLLPRGALEFAHHRMALEPGHPISAIQARAMGELLEARRVVWGSYGRMGGQWQMTVRVLNTASGIVSGEMKATAPDWFGVRDQIAAQVLAELKITPSPGEQQRMEQRPTVSSAAWERYSQGSALPAQAKPSSDQEALLQEALEMDPRFAQAHLRLSSLLASREKYDLAIESAARVLQMQPNLSEAHLQLGRLLANQDRREESERHLREAQRLGPDEAEPLAQLGDLLSQQRKASEAIECWKAAARCDPTSAWMHARLGEAFARNGERERALLELKDAERYAGDEVEIEHTLFRSFDILRDIPAALDHGYKCRLLALKQRGDPALIRPLEMRLRELQVSLKPRAVQAAQPKIYTAETLEAALRERLSAEELRLVTNPLACTPVMVQIAQSETRSAKGDLAKAKKLFVVLARHMDAGPGGALTASEVFATWNNPGASFRCQEYARFYVALARAIGLSSFFTVVDQDAGGRLVAHACAAVFVNGEAWLVDPAYHQFGIPHRKFTILDDLQSVALHLHQQPGDLARQRAAVKLQPDSAIAHFNLAMTLMARHQLDEARGVLSTAVRLEPDSWLAHCAAGYWAGWQGRWQPAEEHLHQTLAMNPSCSRARFFLAEVLQKQGRLKEAREEYRGYLRHELELETNLQEPARRAIAQLNEILAGE